VTRTGGRRDHGACKVSKGCAAPVSGRHIPCSGGKRRATPPVVPSWKRLGHHRVQGVGALSVKLACGEPPNVALERAKSAPAREPRPSPLNAVLCRPPSRITRLRSGDLVA